MEQISFFLKKFKTLGLSSVIAKSAFIEAVEKVLKTKLPFESVELKEETFFVKAHPALKSELYLKREIVLTELSKTLGSLGSKKIR